MKIQDYEKVTITISCASPDDAAYLMAINAAFWYAKTDDDDAVPIITKHLAQAIGYLHSCFNDMVDEDGTVVGIFGLEPYELAWLTKWTGRQFEAPE